MLPLKRSKDGKIIFEFDTNPVETTQIPKGEDITLTIDAAIQHVAEKELFKMTEAQNADGGFAIVMNPKNGEILAYAVYPYFNPNNYAKAAPNELKNWTLTDIYPPGSTFKMNKYKLAAKTGTSKKIRPDGKGYIDGAYYKSVIGYFPATNPEILIYVCIDNPKNDNAFGNTIAGPVFKEIAESAAIILNIPSYR